MRMPMEVWPVVASVGVAVGASCYTLKRKWYNDPQLTFSKTKRGGGTSIAYGDVEDAEPFWSSAKTKSITIFGSLANPILANKLAETPTEMTITVNIPGDDDEEEEEEAAIEDLKVIASEAGALADPEATDAPEPENTTEFDDK